MQANRATRVAAWTPSAAPDTDAKPWLRFGVAGRDAGQMIERAYAIDLQDCVAWCRTVDRTTPHAGAEYATRPLTDGEIEREAIGAC